MQNDIFYSKYSIIRFWAIMSYCKVYTIKDQGIYEKENVCKNFNTTVILSLMRRI